MQVEFHVKVDELLSCCARIVLLNLDNSRNETFVPCTLILMSSQVQVAWVELWYRNLLLSLFGCMLWIGMRFKAVLVFPVSICLILL